MSQKRVFIICIAMLGVSLAACTKKEGPAPVSKSDTTTTYSVPAASSTTVTTSTDSKTTVGGEMKDAMKSAKSEMKDTAAKVENFVDDAAITTAVKADLVKDPDLSAIKIDVDTKQGVVTLTGTAPTDIARERATRLAKSVNGVKSVENKLAIKAKS